MLSHLTDDRLAAAGRRVEVAASLIPLAPLMVGLLGYGALRSLPLGISVARHLIGVARGR